MHTANLANHPRPLASLARGILDATLPQTCVSCGEWIPAGRRLACDACHSAIRAGMHQRYCSRCGRTLPSPAIHEKGCARCRTERFWNVRGVARIGLYGPLLRPILLGLKYAGRERNADYLADLLAMELSRRGWLDRLDAFVPVPMHWLRRLQRRCDHAHVLTETLARRVKLPVLRPVRRVRHSPSQIGITARPARFENVKGCFGPPAWHVPPWPKADVSGKTVCIVDNLLSAGATVYEVSKTLRMAGAKVIYAAVIARPAAPGDPPSEPVPVPIAP